MFNISVYRFWSWSYDEVDECSSFPIKDELITDWEDQNDTLQVLSPSEFPCQPSTSDTQRSFSQSQLRGLASRLPQSTQAVPGTTDPHYPPMVRSYTPAAEEGTGHCGGTELQAFTTLMGLVLSLYLSWGSRLTTTTSGNWFSNQTTFIGLVSSENYYRRPRIITSIT